MYKVDNNAVSSTIIVHFIQNTQAYLMVELTALLATLYIIHKPT
jgi:hypothetical protein